MPFAPSRFPVIPSPQARNLERSRLTTAPSPTSAIRVDSSSHILSEDSESELVNNKGSDGMTGYAPYTIAFSGSILDSSDFSSPRSMRFTMSTMPSQKGVLMPSASPRRAT